MVLTRISKKSISFFKRKILQQLWNIIEIFNNHRELTIIRVCMAMRSHTCVFSSPLYSIKRMDSCYRLYLVFIPNIFYHCRFPFPYDIQRHVLNRREAKSAVKAAKDSKESVAQNLVYDEDTEESCCVYTRRFSPFIFGG